MTETGDRRHPTDPQEETRALPQGLSIRRYEPQDNAGVWELHWEGLVGTTRSEPEVHPVFDADLTRLEEEYLGEGSNFWVVEGPDGLVGMSAIQRIDEQTGRLRRMRVTADWRRKGVAKALLAEALGFCRACGYSRLILDTTEQQTAAQQMYETAGFAKVGERKAGPYTLYDYVLEL